MSTLIFRATSHWPAGSHERGRDYLFVEQPSDDFFCPVTTGLLLQPHLTSCCGNHLSQEAATRIQRERGACPLCKAPHLSTMLDKHFQHEVKKLPVFCYRKDRGCGWQGELAALDCHVQSCPMENATGMTDPIECPLYVSRASHKKLSQAAESAVLTMAVIGFAGQGKATLVNSLLLTDPDSQDTAEASGEGCYVIADVQCYIRSRDNAEITIWDTPGLGDSETMTSEEVLKRLHDGAGGNIDLLLFCIAYRPGLRVDDSHINVIKLLTTLFGKVVWRKALLVFTMVNKIENQKSIPKIAQNVEKGLKNALRGAGVPEDIVTDQRLILAGLGEEPLPINENENIDWNTDFFLYCFGMVKDPSEVRL